MNQNEATEQQSSQVANGCDRQAGNPDVQSAATIAFSVSEWRAFAAVMRDLTWGKACMDKWHYGVRESMDAKAAQAEYEAKRLAAD